MHSFAVYKCDQDSMYVTIYLWNIVILVCQYEEILVINCILVSITSFSVARWTEVVALQWKPTIFFPCTLIYFCQSIIQTGSEIPQTRIPGLKDYNP